MRLRTIVAILACLLLAVFVATNWPAFSTPTTLSVVFASVEAPLGIVMLGVLVVFALAVAAYMAVWQGRTLLDLRRHTRALQEQRTLADQAEASRFTELRGALRDELAALGDRLTQANEAVRKEIRDNGNSLAASVAEMDDRLQRNAGRP